MANKKSIYFDIFARDNSGKTMRGVGKNAQALGDDLKKVGIAVGVGLAAIAAGAIKAGVDAVQALQRIEVINAQTDAVIQSTGAAANVTRSQVAAMADSLEQLTATEAESIQEGANLLLTFTQIRNGAGANEKVFDRTVTAMVDMARAMGTDARSAALQLGKAINDPIRGMSQLSRVGVSFTDDQRDLIASLQESGDLFGAQGVLLDALEQQFGGSGAAYAATLSGQMDLLNHNMGATAETIVANLMPHLQDALEWMNTDGVDMLTDFADWFTEDAIPVIDDFIKKLEEMGEDGTLVPTVVGGLVAITGAQIGLNAAMAANPIGLVILALATLAAQFTYVMANFESFKVTAEDTGWGKPLMVMLTGWFGIFAAFAQNWDTIWFNIAMNFTIQINGMIAAINFLLAPLQAVLDVINSIAGTRLSVKLDRIEYPRAPGAPSTQTPVNTSQMRGMTLMADGGIVQPTRGGTPAIIGEAGYPEAVIPLTRTALAEYGIGGGETHIHVTLNGVIGSSRSETMKFIVKGIQDAVKLGDIPRGALA